MLFLLILDFMSIPTSLKEMCTKYLFFGNCSLSYSPAKYINVTNFKYSVLNKDLGHRPIVSKNLLAK